jgi:hypothetical protein
MPTPEKLTDEEAKARLDSFRQMRLDGDFCFSINFTHSPKVGDEAHYFGTVWGTWNEQGPLTRFQLSVVVPKDAKPDATAKKPEVWQWLVQNGKAPKVWVLAPGETKAREVPPADWRKPLFPGVVYTPFDLLMPFIFWPDAKYQGPSRLLERSTDIYQMQPPKDEQSTTTGAVRVTFDREYKVPIFVEQLDEKGQVAREFTVDKFQNAQDQWLLKQYNLTDKVSHDHDSFTLTAAALHQKLDPVTFDPAHLGEPAKLPPVASWTAL